MGRQKVWEAEVVERGAPSSGGSRQDGPSGPKIKLEATKKKGEMAEAPARPGGGACLTVGSVEVMDHTTSPAGGGSIRSRKGEGRSTGQNGLTRKSAGRKSTGGATSGWTGTI